MPDLSECKLPLPSTIPDPSHRPTPCPVLSGLQAAHPAVATDRFVARLPASCALRKGPTPFLPTPRRSRRWQIGTAGQRGAARVVLSKGATVHKLAGRHCRTLHPCAPAHTFSFGYPVCGVLEKARIHDWIRARVAAVPTGFEPAVSTHKVKYTQTGFSTGSQRDVRDPLSQKPPCAASRLAGQVVELFGGVPAGRRSPKWHPLACAAADGLLMMLCRTPDSAAYRGRAK